MMNWDVFLLGFSTTAQLLVVIYVIRNFEKLFRLVVADAESQRSEFCSLLKHSVDTIKAKSLAERALVETEEKRSEVQIEMLKDAWVEERESGITVDPIYARTDAGKEINIREYDIL